MAPPFFSIVVPSLNDGERLRENVPPLLSSKTCEVIVVEAGSVPVDFPQVVVKSERANRAYQMNLGAKRAKGEILLFLHADTRISPDTLVPLYREFQSNPQLVGGAFRFALDSPSWKARIMEFGVRLREITFDLPYGDQAIFVRRSVFEEIGGYPDVPLLEDVLLIRKLKRKGWLHLYSEKAMTSARKWEDFGYLKTMFANWETMFRWSCGTSFEDLIVLRKKRLGRTRKGEAQRNESLPSS